jgi:hypothetical protein
MAIITMTIDTSELSLMTGDHGYRDTKKHLQHCCNPSDPNDPSVSELVT